MQNKTALITGASGGIGYEFAKLLAKDCSVLILVARSLDRLLEVKKELESIADVSVRTIAKDLSKPGVTEEIYRELENENISVDILINNAGIGSLGKFAETDWQKDAEMISLNIVALTHLTKLFVKGMIERRSGKIVNVASTAAFQPGPLMAVYYASKAYVLSFSEAIANELKGTGVNMTVLCPGPTATGFVKAAAVGESRLFRIRRPAEALDVARYGYEAMMKGKTVAIHGMLSKIVALSTRVAPRNALLSISRRLNENVRS
ncbi:MAG TPA: SDR family oxidoreductase [Nitrospirota bacterium]|nr:SDR family oxidoreductase [Nitrospirota bacterium]